MLDLTGNFTKKITFVPAYDYRDKGAGIHGMEMRFVLRGTKGAVSFTVFTNWQLPQIEKEWEEDNDWKKSQIFDISRPSAAGVFYHAYQQTKEYEIKNKSCLDLDGDPCYSDGTSLSDEYLEVLVSEGEDALWSKLEAYYMRHLYAQETLTES